MALKSAKMAGLDIGNSFEWAMAFVEKITPEIGGDEYNPTMDHCSYIYNSDTGDTGHKNATLTSIGLLCRVFIDKDREDVVLKAHAEKLLNHLPEKGKSDYYQWYYSTLAMFQMGGDYWKKYNKAMLDTFIATQAVGGCADGSWEAPEGSSCHGTRRGGRLFATASACLSLEVYWRYDKVNKKAGR
jgi:hypothetical protein